MNILDPIDNLIDSLQHHKNKRYGTRPLDILEKIIVHHSGTKNGKARSYARYHVKNLNWPGIGYHYVADKDGIHQTNDLSTLSYHTKGQNLNSIGICLTGNFDLRPPTDPEYWQWIQMIIDIDKRLGKELPVYYHRDYSSKLCPGMMFDKIYFEKELKDFRMILGEN